MIRVLVTDDSSWMRKFVKDTIAQCGCETVAEATNGEEAVKLYQELLPDLVTMDLTMPVMDGLTALRKIRSIDPSAMIMVCSSMGQEDTVKEAIAAGAVDYIIKPFPPERLIQAIEKLRVR